MFTPAALLQLESKGFKVLYIEYNNIIQAFASAGINASFDEKTLETEFQNKINQWNNLSVNDIGNIKNKLLSLEHAKIDNFINTLEQTFSRRVQSVNVTILHGLSQQIVNIESAIEYIQQYPQTQLIPTPALKYEIDIRYNNGSTIHAIFQSKFEAIRFLRTFV